MNIVLYKKASQRYQSLVANKARNTPSWASFHNWVEAWNDSGRLCEYCNRKIDLHDNNEPFSKQMSLDHRLPLCHGGDNRLENLALVCNRCNLIKTTMKEETYRELLFYVSQNNELMEKILSESYKGRLAYKLQRLEKATDLAPIDLPEELSPFYLPPHTALFCPDCRRPLSAYINTGKLICLYCSQSGEEKIFYLVREEGACGQVK